MNMHVLGMRKILMFHQGKYMIAYEYGNSNKTMIQIKDSLRHVEVFLVIVINELYWQTIPFCH